MADPLIVWLLWHTRTGGLEADDELLIGAYSNEALARDAAARLGTRPGFAEHPTVVDGVDRYEPGFIISELTVDRDGWPDGFRIEPGGPRSG